MNKIELIEKFLEEKGLVWEDRKLIDVDKKGKTVIFTAKDEHFNKDKVCVLLVTIPSVGINEPFEIVISVDILSFFTWGIGYEMPACFAVTDEFRDILDENNLSTEWQDFCVKNKGFVYKIAVDKYIKEQKQIASDNCHKQTIKYINAIKKETETKNNVE